MVRQVFLGKRCTISERDFTELGTLGKNQEVRETVGRVRGKIGRGETTRRS